VVADITIASFFHNASFAHLALMPDVGPGLRHSSSASSRSRVSRSSKPIEETLIRTPIAKVRGVLTERKVPLTCETYGTAQPRRGMMRID
jgi:hypothetical protein